MQSEAFRALLTHDVRMGLVFVWVVVGVSCGGITAILTLIRDRKK